MIQQLRNWGKIVKVIFDPHGIVYTSNLNLLYHAIYDFINKTYEIQPDNIVCRLVVLIHFFFLNYCFKTQIQKKCKSRQIEVALKNQKPQLNIITRDRIFLIPQNEMSNSQNFSHITINSMFSCARLEGEHAVKEASSQLGCVWTKYTATKTLGNVDHLAACLHFLTFSFKITVVI